MTSYTYPTEHFRILREVMEANGMAGEAAEVDVATLLRALYERIDDSASPAVAELAFSLQNQFVAEGRVGQALVDELMAALPDGVGDDGAAS